jgi:hypothetical protein
LINKTAIVSSETLKNGIVFTVSKYFLDIVFLGRFEDGFLGTTRISLLARRTDILFPMAILVGSDF